MKLALLYPLACVVGLSAAASKYVPKGGVCKDKNGNEGTCQQSGICRGRTLRMESNCDPTSSLTCCGHVHCTGSHKERVYLCETESSCSLIGSFDYGGTCPGYEGYREKVGCCTRSAYGDSGTGDNVATSSGLDLGLGDQTPASGFGLGDNPVASGGIDLGTGDNQFDASGGLGLEHSNGFVPSGRFVGLGQDDEIVASNGFGPGQGDQAVTNNWLGNLAAGNGPLDLRYGNWQR